MEKSLSLEELKDWVEDLVEGFSSKQIVCLEGPLGAGKTKLVEEILNHLGVKEPVSSPTFSLINHYKTSKIPFIVHMDLYRIEGEDDLESTGFWDIFSKDEALVFIEWSDRLKKDDLPLGWDIQVVKIAKNEGDENRLYDSYSV